jgi:hypothetical protein
MAGAQALNALLVSMDVVTVTSRAPGASPAAMTRFAVISVLLFTVVAETLMASPLTLTVAPVADHPAPGWRFSRDAAGLLTLHAGR